MDTPGSAIASTIEMLVREFHGPAQERWQNHLTELAERTETLLRDVERRIGQLELRFGLDPREAVAKDIDRLEQRVQLLRDTLR